MIGIWKWIKPYITGKSIIYSIFLFFSCCLLASYLSDMVEDPAIKLWVKVFAVCLDIGAQYVFAKALYEWTRGKWKKGFYKYRITALILFIIFGVYEICFAAFSAVSFFLVQVDKKEKANQAIVAQITDNRDKLKDIKDELTILNDSLKTETKTGFRQYSQSIIDRKKELQAQRDIIEKSNNVITKNQNDISISAVNSFDVTADNFGIPKKRAKVLTFGIAILMLQTFLVLFCIRIKVEKATVIEAPKSALPDTLPGELPEKALFDNPDKHKKELSQYAEALYSTDTKKLNGDLTISKKTGIPFERCVEYRKFLCGLHIGDKPAIKKKQGGSVSDFTKEELQAFIRNNDLKIA